MFNHQCGKGFVEDIFTRDKINYNISMNKYHLTTSFMRLNINSTTLLFALNSSFHKE